MHRTASRSTWVCEACTYVFQIFFSPSKRQTPYCPGCADNFDVVRYEAQRHLGEGRNTKTRWTKEELELLEQCKNRKILPYQVAIMTGRSINAVVKKLKRVMKDDSS